VEAPTEQRNTATEHIDTLDSLGVLKLVNAEDAQAARAVAAALPKLARAFVAHVAGGPPALVRAVEDVEDDEAAGQADAAGVMAGDVVVGITASGRTPYAAGALRAARGKAATTVLVSSNPGALLAATADVHVLTDTGPEAVTGSTRMKAGTAQKMVLHSFSTAVMVRLGRTYSNLMIDVAPNNSKLRARQVTILHMAAGEGEERCGAVLDAAGGDLRVALVSLLAGVGTDAARTRLEAVGGNVRAAVATGPAVNTRPVDRG
jgi:N-acetylmuramic acid 6-phosphate etherase